MVPVACRMKSKLLAWHENFSDFLYLDPKWSLPPLCFHRTLKLSYNTSYPTLLYIPLSSIFHSFTHLKNIYHPPRAGFVLGAMFILANKTGKAR